MCRYSRDFLQKINKSLLDERAVERWEGLSHMENANSKLLRAAGSDFQGGRGGMRGPPPHMGATKGDDRWSRGKPLAGNPGDFLPRLLNSPTDEGQVHSVSISVLKETRFAEKERFLRKVFLDINTRST